MNRLYRSSVVLFVLNGFGGLLNYLFLYIAVKRLPMGELGEFMSELTIYGVALAFGTFAQYWAVFAPMPISRLRVIRWVGLALSAAMLAWFVSGGLRAMPLRYVLFSALPLAILMQFVAGRFQRAYAFTWFGAGSALWAASKLSVAYLGSGQKDFALAFPIATALVLIIAFLALRFTEEEVVAGSISGSPGVRQQLSFSFVTALGYSWLPAYDLLTVRYLMGVDQAGALAHLQLFSKVLYYAPLALLQVTLPHYIKVLNGVHSASGIAQLRKLEWQGLLVSYLVVAVFAAAGPIAAERFLGIGYFTARQIGLVCLSVVPLYGLLSGIQIFAAARDLGKGLLLLGSTLVIIAIAVLIGFRTVDQYLAYAAIANTFLGIFGWSLASHLLRARLGNK